MVRLILYVDPINGRDDGDGRSQTRPLKTIAAALRSHQDETTIQLKAGRYAPETGEQFPITVPSGCELVGEMQGDRPATILQGSGLVRNNRRGNQSVTCRLQENAVLRNAIVTNTQTRGIGLWFDAGSASMERVIASNCAQYGAAAIGIALPILKNCVFEGCDNAGIAFLDQSKGQIERGLYLNNGTGLLLEDGAAPLVLSCRIERNRVGIAISGTANPVLRNNRIRNNQTYGIQLLGRATADLGQAEDVGSNIIRSNGQSDIQNGTGRSLISCGNDVLPQRLQGSVELIATKLPDPSAIPITLLDRPKDLPPKQSPPEPPSVITTPKEIPEARGSRFRDMANHWAGPFVDGLAQAGVVAGLGDGTFQPNRQVTRAEFASFVVTSFPDRPETKSPHQFRDVSRSFWGYEALSQAQRMGFLTGFPDGTMRPNDSITRIQAMVAISNGLGLSGGRADDIALYRDRAQVPSYAIDALATATQRRLVVNHPDSTVLRPSEPITRGEVAAIIYQGRVAAGKSQTISSPYIVQPDSSQPLFSDLQGHWATDFVRELTEANLIRGMSDGRFAPDEAINRAQFAALIAQAFQPAPIRPAKKFVDVPTTYWGAEAIQVAYQGGFLIGFPDETFAPTHSLVRVQVWVALVNGLRWDDSSVSLQPLGQFVDYTTIPRYALSQTAIALQRRLIANYPNPARLRPNQIATRAEVSTAIYQALVALNKFPPLSSQYIP